MHTDPRVTYNFFGLTSAGAGTYDVQVEATAAILAREGRVTDDDTTSGVPKATSANNDSVHCPAGASIEGFGVTLTEALTNANATHCIVALKVIALEGAAATTPATITLPKDTTEVTVANARATDGTPSATQCVAIGARIRSSDTDVPILIPQGGKFYVEVTQAAGAAGGAFRAWVIVRQNGQENPGTKAASPILSIAS